MLTLSVLYKDSTSEFDTASEKVAFTHDSQGYMFLIMVTPPSFYDDPKFTEIRERVINSTEFHSQNSTEWYLLFLIFRFYNSLNILNVIFDVKSNIVNLNKR